MAGDPILRVSVDFDPLTRFVDDLQRRQVPFVTAVTLTKLAKLGRDATVASLPRHFTIRTPWLAKGTRFTPADKRDWPFCEAQVGQKDQFMVAQELGGKKVPKPGGKSVAEPLAARPTPQSLTRPSQWPRAQLKRPRTFLRRLTQGPNKGAMAVLRREGSDRYPLQVLYVFKPSTPVKARLGMRKTVEGVASKHLVPVFLVEMQKAVGGSAGRFSNAAGLRAQLLGP